MVNVETCLPANLRGSTTTIARIAAGLSGAGVYRVDAAGRAFVMKIASASEPVAVWRRKLQIQQSASNAGVAPRIVHVDEDRRAIVSEFVVDRSFVARYMDPRTREEALSHLARTLRRVHALPLPAEPDARNGLEFLSLIWSGLSNGFATPAFVADAVRRMLAEEPPDSGRALVLSHNDVNPTNLVYDGENVLLFDWETAAPNDPFFDLAAISVFLRMDDDTCRALLAAYDGQPVSVLPERFRYDQRLAAVMCGAAFLHLARNGGHAGATGAETLDSTASLSEFYGRMRSGQLTIATGEGQWAFGLALVKAGATI